ncbi:MAG TPA: hypothetical protein VGB91_03190 [Rhizomicrobium sp.]
MSTPIRTFFPRTRLSELAARAGGMPRDLAIESAKASLETMRGESTLEIARSIGELEKIVAAPAAAAKLGRGQLTSVLRVTDQIVSLAGMFDLTGLDVAARSLCDVADGLLNRGMDDLEPVAVHVQALRLMASSGAALPPEGVATILGELAKVVAHFNFTPIGAGVPADDELCPALPLAG